MVVILASAKLSAKNAATKIIGLMDFSNLAKKWKANAISIALECVGNDN